MDISFSASSVRRAFCSLPLVLVAVVRDMSAIENIESSCSEGFTVVATGFASPIAIVIEGTRYQSNCNFVSRASVGILI